MAQRLAPYNNAMRLGQGFNSYTHEICLHNAVTVPPPHYLANDSSARDWVHADDNDGAYDEDLPEEKAQIVTYSTRFVEKISEVVGEVDLSNYQDNDSSHPADSMNISAALSINTNTIGGSANGQYIDSDKFKQSDINYFVQVRVTNQRLDIKARSQLNLVTSVEDTGSGQHSRDRRLSMDKFRDVYGVSTHIGLRKQD